MKFVNPFSITKAVDLSDHAIFNLWVEMPKGGGTFLEMIKPNSPMPQIILGGKGSGKTHLMKYYSYLIRKIYYKDEIYEGIKKDGFIGIYFRCGGLNASRFTGKGYSHEQWQGIFAYYFDLWIALNFLMLIEDLIGYSKPNEEQVRLFCKGTEELFNNPFTSEINTIQQLQSFIRSLQINLDNAVNNCALTGKLEVTIQTNQGSLVFGLPKLASKLFGFDENILFIYMLDEFENLTELQQKYVQTLLREKEPPSTFRIGARLFGVKTYNTFSSNERNLEGSEYEIVPLDNLLRENSKYYEFSKSLVEKRLTENGFPTRIHGDIHNFFQTTRKSRYAKDETDYIVNSYKDKERPYFSSLKKRISMGIKNRAVVGINNEGEAEQIVSHLRCNEYPLLEKVNIFLLYKDWSSKENLMQSSRTIQEDCLATITGSKKKTRQTEALDYFQGDLLAQLFRETKKPQKYYGFETLILLSNGLPRNLLILLKNIYKWSVFNGDEPFKEKPITIKSQIEGITESSEWFYKDAQLAHEANSDVQEGIARLCELFRDIRYSNKPAECSLCTFSTEVHKCSEAAKRVIDLAEKLSLLISVQGGRKNKNNLRTSDTYQINPMLAPRWDLPISRRGVIELQSDEVNSIFDKSLYNSFDSVRSSRIARMNAPSFGLNSNYSEGVQPTFLEFE